MLQTLKLLLPALMPSWRFFDTITASPRIEFALLKTPQDAAGNWREFRPRPARLAARCMLKRLFWNPRWNESLFLVSCAERLVATGAEHSEREIFNRLRAGLAVDATATPYLQFRVMLVGRGEEKQVAFISPVENIRP